MRLAGRRAADIGGGCRRLAPPIVDSSARHEPNYRDMPYEWPIRGLTQNYEELFIAPASPISSDAIIFRPSSLCLPSRARSRA